VCIGTPVRYEQTVWEQVVGPCCSNLAMFGALLMYTNMVGRCRLTLSNSR